MMNRGLRHALMAAIMGAPVATGAPVVVLGDPEPAKPKSKTPERTKLDHRHHDRSNAEQQRRWEAAEAKRARRCARNIEFVERQKRHRREMAAIFALRREKWEEANAN